MNSGEYPKFNSGTLEGTLKKNLFQNVEVENRKWKCPPISYVKPSGEGFTIPLTSFSSLLVSSF